MKACLPFSVELGHWATADVRLSPATSSLFRLPDGSCGWAGQQGDDRVQAEGMGCPTWLLSLSRPEHCPKG